MDKIIINYQEIAMFDYRNQNLFNGMLKKNQTKYY